MNALAVALRRAETRPDAEPVSLEVQTRRLVSDLHRPKPAVYWSDLSLTAVVGWGAFALAVAATPGTWAVVGWGLLSSFALYRALCFTHELSHLRRRALPGFETAWNLAIGVPLLMPSFTYVGVHQSHHSLQTYGTKGDPEYLPFQRSRPLIVTFSLQSSLLVPLLLVVRFLVLAPIGLLWPACHRWLETRASSFAMNPLYRRVVPADVARRMKRWELGILAFWAGVAGLVSVSALPVRALGIWLAVMAVVSFVNTMRVLGAHEYETDGAPRDRDGQLADSIDTPGGPWTELWAPVGLRYHALHHYFPGIPYHNLGKAYRRIMRAVPDESPYRESTSPGLRHSITTLYQRARRQWIRLTDW